MDIQEALNELNQLSSADAVARFFSDENIYGEPAASYACPVAKYLNRKLRLSSGYAGAHVGVYKAQVGDQKVDLPPAVFEFRRRFDRGDYPNLNY